VHGAFNEEQFGCPQCFEKQEAFKISSIQLIF